jgi:hypothetical protein
MGTQLVVFEASGSVRYVQESAYTLDKKFTVATVYALPGLETTSLGDPLAPVSNDNTPGEPSLCTIIVPRWMRPTE